MGIVLLFVSYYFRKERKIIAVGRSFEPSEKECPTASGPVACVLCVAFSHHNDVVLACVYMQKYILFSCCDRMRPFHN